jgi:5-methyltetrahydropteroyltriglutamate--homocysteine methyltransferase
MDDLPLLPVATVGSWPRTAQAYQARRELFAGRLSKRDFNRVADTAVLAVRRQQIESGVDLVTDGEQRRDSFYSFVSTALEGAKLLTLAELLNTIEDRAALELMLQTLDVPAYAVRNPACVAALTRRAPLAADEVRFLKRHTALPVKVALPGPYLLSRAMWVPEVSSPSYASLEELSDAIVSILREEVTELLEVGVAFIQLDEPILTALASDPGTPRTFMCAPFARRPDSGADPDLAVSLINWTVNGFAGAHFGLHTCRGNWSRDESILLSGTYTPLGRYFARMDVQQLVLDYATERAGDLLPFGDKEIGLGVVNPRSDTIETPHEVQRSIELALTIYPAQRIFLNPDCGFGTFAERPLVAAARRLRASLKPLSSQTDVLQRSDT